MRKLGTSKWSAGKWSVALLLALVVANPTTVDAQRAKFTRNQEVKVNVKLSDRTKPRGQKETTKQAAPEVTADQVLLVEGKVGALRQEMAVEIADLIEDTPDSEVNEKADLYFQLAELHAGSQRYWRLTSMDARIKADTAKNPGEKKGWTDKADKAAAKAKNALIDAVKVYKALADNDRFRNYPKMDHALFYYGYTLQSGTYMKEARSVYDRLLKNYPQSIFVPEAHLAFADYHYFNNQLPDAEARYRRVLQFPKSSVYMYAKYMLGWVYLNQSKNQEALEVFYDVAMATRNDKKQGNLHRASKKDIVRAYAAVGNVEKAYPYFQKVDKSAYSFTMYGLLGDFYLDQGKTDKAIYVYRDLIGLAPKNKSVCLWQYNVAQAMLTAGTNPQKVEEIESLVKLYAALKGAKVLPAEEGKECYENAAAMSYEMATAWHSESVKTRNPETLAYADKLYRVFVQTFPEHPDFPAAQYYSAEVLWTRAETEKNQRLQTELWEDAAVAFTDVVKAGKVNDAQKKESAYAAVLAWKNALNVDPRVKAPPPEANKGDEKIPTPQEIPQRELRMIEAFDVYIKYVKDPKDSDLIDMKFLKANLYRRYHQYDKAIPIFEDILAKHRSHPTAEFSANILLDSYNRLQRFDELVAMVDKLSKDKAFLEGKDDLAGRLEVLQIQSERKKAEVTEKQAKESGDVGKYIECGKAYTTIYNRNPEAEGNDEVLYNAAVCFEQGKSIGLAIGMYKRLENLTNADKNVKARGMARLGVAYAQVAFYEQAAKYLELYFEKYGATKNDKELKDAKDALNDAVFYRKGLGQDELAIKNTLKYVGHPQVKPEDRAGAFFGLHAIYEKNNDSAGLIKHLQRYLREFASKGAPELAVIAHTKIGQALWDQSCPTKTVDGACVEIERERALANRGRKGKRKRVVQTQCGETSKVKVTVKRRDERRVREAMSEFQKAIATYERGKADGATYFYALAKFYQGDKEFEQYLNVEFPANLNFDSKNPALLAKSKKRINDWVERKQKQGEVARVKYVSIDGTKDAANMIAARARLGQMAQNFSDALYTAEIPAQLRPYEEAVEDYCDQLTQLAEPLEAFTITAFTTCLVESTRLGWYSDWSKLCERELGQIKPEEFPTASELKDNPDQTSTIIDVELPAARLE